MTHERGTMNDPYDRIVELEYTIDYSYVDAVGDIQYAHQSYSFKGTINQLNETLNSIKQNFPFPAQVSFIQRKCTMADININIVTLEFLNTILRP